MSADSVEFNFPILLAPAADGSSSGSASDSVPKSYKYLTNAFSDCRPHESIKVSDLESAVLKTVHKHAAALNIDKNGEMEVTIYELETPLRPEPVGGFISNRQWERMYEAVDETYLKEKTWMVGQTVENPKNVVAVLIVAPRVPPMSALPASEELAGGQARMDALQSIHKKAWGKPWPSKIERIRKEDVGFDADEPMEVDSAEASDPGSVKAPGPYVGDDPVPVEWEYTCLLEINPLGRGWGIRNMPDVIVVREEYRWLLKILKDRNKSTVLVGHPGIGKTVFLIYLLLYRLEQQLPTAVQFERKVYALFNSSGVKIYPAEEPVPTDCWALSDSNALVLMPCAGFISSLAPIIQAASPHPDRSKKWAKYNAAGTVIFDLPKVLEVAAIAREQGLDASHAVSLMRKWGPCTRTVLDILRDLSAESTHSTSVTKAAWNVSRDPLYSLLAEEANSRYSSLMFICPARAKSSSSSVYSIPTPHLAGIFDDSRIQVSNEDARRLYNAFSTHSLTRSGAGWLLEKTMHAYMSSGREALKIFGSGKSEDIMRPTTRQMSGTVDGLKEAQLGRSFYWFPSVANFPGIDGVLVDPPNIYLLQATIAEEEHGSPADGIRKVWQTVGATTGVGYTWHFVVVTHDEFSARDYAETLTKDLAAFSLGKADVKVSCQRGAASYQNHTVPDGDGSTIK